MSTSLTATITTPCTGTVTLTELVAGYYTDTSGAGGFSYVTLIKNGDCWYLTVYTNDTSSSCYPSTVYKQDPCDAESAMGSYYFWDGISYKRKLGRATIQ